MTTLRKSVSAFVFVGGLLLAARAQADSACANLRGKGVGQDPGTGTTTARIIGGGLLHGTTVANFSIVGGTAPVFDIAGAMTFNTSNGSSLTFNLSGTFDVATGDFAVTANATSGTGQLSAATGTLTITGIEDFTTGEFAEDWTGTVCLNN